MPYAITIALVFLLLFLILYRIENKNHQRNLNAIPIRILVTGSRGKSSITRLIAAGLRAYGKNVVAKTTGTSTRLIFSNTEEESINRIGMPCIREQITIIAETSKVNPDVLVIECMALRPELQWTESMRIIKPTVVVITNVRADHLDVMGPTIKDIAKTFISVVPKDCKVFTAESRTIDVFIKNIPNRNIEIFTSKPDRITETIIKKFSYIEHKENVALALDVCRYFGIDKKLVLESMYTATPDPGVSRIYTIDLGRKKITFINALAANDPESTYYIWQLINKNYPEINLLINSRRERIDRSLQFAKFIKNFDVDYYILTGSGANILARNLNKIIDRSKIFNLGEKKPEQVFNEVSKCVSDRSLLFAIGNAVGYGTKLLEYFLRKGKYNGS